METPELSEDVLPMSNAFKLLCDDSTPKVNKKEVERQRQTAKKIKNEIESAKINLEIEVFATITEKLIFYNFQYKNLDFWTEHDIKHPLHHLQKAIDATSSSVTQFKWVKPSKITISDQVFVEMPSELLGNRDFLNLTYPTKRAHFLCCIAKILSKNHAKIHFAAGGIQQDDPIFPDLIVDGIRVGIYCSDMAKPKRFAPNIGNLRPATVFGEKLFKGVEIATPRFNQRMLWSVLELDLNQELEKTMKTHPTARLALHLLQSLLENRHLTHAFSKIVTTARVVRLIKNGEITEKQEILTVLRAIFKDFITWSPDDVEHMDVDEEKLEDDVEEEYSQNFDVNLIWRHLNIASNITKNQMARMKKELATCYPLLGQVYTFDPIFIEKFPVFAQYDHVSRLHVNVSQLLPIIGEFGCDSVDNRDVISQFIKSLERKIQQTMSERYEFIGIHEITEDLKTTWQLTDYASQERQKTFLIGFRITSQWKNPLTVGPSAQTNEAKEFRELWKGSSELRKFADTRICECVVWAEKPSEKVPRAVLQFVLQKMFDLPATCLSWRSLTTTSTSAESDQQHEKKSQEAVFKAFTDLSQVLRGLKGIPLMITNVHGVSGYLRGTEPAYPSVFAATSSNKSTDNHALPETGKIPLYSPAVTVHIKLEYSGKWGNDVEAIRRSTWSSFSRLLTLLSTHPWSSRPLVVDFGLKSWTEEERSKLEEKFIKMRPILPPMVVIHEEDQLGSKFTRENPQGIVLNRLVAVAKEALKLMEKQTIGQKSIDLETSLLTENLAPYDAIIHLEPAAVVRKKALMERRPLPENSKFQHKIPVVELDPVDELVYQLNNSFQSVAMFFYNKYGGHHIGVMFKPQEEEVPAKISRCALHKSISDSTLRLNRAEILENILILGQGIVGDVELKKQ
ncbi:CRE-NOL-6 protein [Caenorhabditis remanei]|uniref:Nucleolar protein 6 n=1 Tax=Caenorhabditis remanei TaxID=31234 RepID=E3MDM2_CAERE|nr:CRE-NOL-6 protein [Caenorhabditis remanei]